MDTNNTYQTDLIPIEVDVEESLYNQVHDILAKENIEISTLLKVYFAKIVQYRGIPFEVCIYNEDTNEAFNAALDSSVLALRN